MITIFFYLDLTKYFLYITVRENLWWGTPFSILVQFRDILFEVVEPNAAN